jgi:opacity protein-like surface antigen
VKWGDLTNTACDAADPASCDPSVVHGGKAAWRFSYALMAGASYCLTDKLQLDAGYRYRRVESGAMFGLDAPGGNGPGYDHGMNIHEGRAGLRYSFGGASNCASERVAYQPEPLEPPVYK